MSETEPIDLFRAARRQKHRPPAPNPPQHGVKRPGITTAFNRRELNDILGLYGRKVAAGEWRDYAIDMMREKAVFSIFRKSSEMPLYRIVKQPHLTRKQGAYSILAPTGLILKRGHDLPQVLRAIDRKPRLVLA